MRSVLYGVGVYDAPTLATVAAALGLIILVAALAPTLRIARIDPARTLREE
jgi:ABC-type lipoprotein release transport system permease subunit